MAEARQEEKGTDRSLTELVGCVNGLKWWKKGERKQSWTNPRVSELHNRTQSGIVKGSKGQSPQDEACVCVGAIVMMGCILYPGDLLVDTQHTKGRVLVEAKVWKSSDHQKHEKPNRAKD